MISNIDMIDKRGKNQETYDNIFYFDIILFCYVTVSPIPYDLPFLDAQSRNTLEPNIGSQVPQKLHRCDLEEK